jgi:hypothetical protein
MNETQRRLRGHRFLPAKSELAKISGCKKTERIPVADKVIHVHYFSAAFDYWLAEIWPETEDGETRWYGFGFASLASFPDGEWSLMDFTDMEQVQGRTPQGLPIIIERDLWWQPKKFSEIKEANR